MNKYLMLALLLIPLLIAGFWALLWSPAQNQIMELEEQTVQAEDQQVERRRVLTELEGVQDNQDTYLAEIAAGNEILPFDANIEETLDQVQAAGELSLSEVSVVSVSRPRIVEMMPRPPSLGLDQEIVAYSVQLQVTGDFFNIAEFVRTVEDSEVVPRAFVWSNVSLAVADEEQNLLTGSLGADLFAVVPAGGEEPEPETEGEGDGTGEGENLEDPLEVE